MATLTVQKSTKRDWLGLRRVRQRVVPLASPWSRHRASRPVFPTLLHGAVGSAETLTATVDDELCGYAMFDRDDNQFRWNLCWLGAGSRRVDATPDVALELWTALIEEGIRQAGRSGARRLFAYGAPSSVAYEGLQAVGFTSFCRYQVLRGRLRSELREDHHVRPQHDSDLWSIHQLYNQITPRPVQFAEAFTSDTWSTRQERRISLRSPDRFGFVVPSEDGIGVACQIRVDTSNPVVSLFCEPEYAYAIPSIVADALEQAAIDEQVDVVVPDYLHELIRPFEVHGFSAGPEIVGMVRHTTARAVQREVAVETVDVREIQPAIVAPTSGASNWAAERVSKRPA